MKTVESKIDIGFAVAMIFVILFCVISLIAMLDGTNDAHIGQPNESYEPMGHSRAAVFIQHWPTYYLGYWLASN